MIVTPHHPSAMVDSRSDASVAMISEDDDESCATFSTVFCWQDATCLDFEDPESSTFTPTKRVRFNEDGNLFHVNTQITKEDRKELWYNKDDYRYFKDVMIQLAKEVASQHRRDSSPTSYRNIMMRTYQACRQSFIETDLNILTVSENKALGYWLAGDDSGSSMTARLLGAEKHVLRPIGRDRFARRELLVDCINATQQTTLELSLSLDEQATLIREASLEITRPSRLFARHIAQAQAAANY